MGSPDEHNGRMPRDRSGAPEPDGSPDSDPWKPGTDGYRGALDHVPEPPGPGPLTRRSASPGGTFGPRAWTPPGGSPQRPRTFRDAPAAGDGPGALRPGPRHWPAQHGAGRPHPRRPDAE